MSRYKSLTLLHSNDLHGDFLAETVDEKLTGGVSMLSGYVNKVVPAGKNRLIRWKAFQDLGYGDYPEIRFKFLTQEKHINTQPIKYSSHEMKTFATLNASYGSQGIPMVGFTVGQYNKYGWFVTLMTGLDFDYMGYQV
ncbi:MAG: hypothetical protein IKV55_03040, partial [Oscillospiraceae bacterium]|nr:hypothetical protein [Oscillospiraceae bacterium]